jgi:predicted ATPase/class 3 adenylate cyclase/DNA-binding CsgD family transcriptional regulator
MPDWGVDPRPTGTVTFLFTDVEGSTRLWEEHPAEMPASLARHDKILRTSIERRDGFVFATTGEGFAVAFTHPRDAIDTAVEIQQGLTTECPPGELPLTVRMGVYTGEASERDGVYAGPVLNRAARIMAAGHGGQILVGAPTASLLEDVDFIDLGEHGLKDLAGAEHVFQVRAAGLRTEFPPLQTLDARRGNLPAPATTLVGRASELAEILDVVRANRLVTLTGVGGVGKTRLALEVGAVLADEYPDGIWLVELAPVGDLASVPDAIATAFGITPQAGASLTQTVAEALSGRRLLMLLDNCEHVVDAAADAVAAILSRLDAPTVLATSRESLRVAGEQLMPVPPLALDGGTESAAVTLFLERARAVNPGFGLDDVASAEAVTEICHGLDGLALAIELAAARMVSLTPVDLRQRLLADRFRLLTGSKRQRSLRETVGWSYDLLDDEERAVLQYASIFSGGFGVDAIANVMAADGVHAGDTFDVLDRLDSLVRKSLVTASHSSGQVRYGLLETIRQFAENELSGLGTIGPARDRHARYFAREVTARWERWNGPGFREAVDWVDVEFANLRAAFRWSAARDDVETAADIAAHAVIVGVSAEMFETVGWVEEIIDAATAADVRRLPRVYTAAGYSCFTGRPEQAVTYAQAAARLETNSRYEAFEPGFANFIEALAQVYSGHLDKYVELTQKVAGLPGVARAYGLPGLVDGLQATGRVEEAMNLADEAVAAARKHGNPWYIAYALWTRGTAYARVDPARALTAWREGLAYVQQHRVHFFEGFIARDAALLKLVDADPEESLALFEAAIDSFRRVGNIAQLTITLASVTSLFERIDRPEAAGTLYGAITRQPGSEHHVPDLPDLAERIAKKLGADRFDECASTGAAMDLTATAHYARDEIQSARAELATRAPRPANPAGLSRREVQVLRLVAEGLTTREIANRLYISPKTADHHIQHVYTKIGVSNRAGATLWAFQHDVVD